MIQINNKVYQWDTMLCEWILCGIVEICLDGEYIEWFA